MLSRFSDVLQSAADVLAPPASRVEDFEYHWKLILYYYNSNDDKRVLIEDTRIPFHLYQMLQFLVDEESEDESTIGTCLEMLLDKEAHILDCLTLVASVDVPGGARGAILLWFTCLLRRLKRPILDQAMVYKPLQRLLIQCNEISASPTEKEEVELLLTICGIVRTQTGLANVFTTPFLDDRNNLMHTPEELLRILPIKSKLCSPPKNQLFESEPVLRCVTLVTQDDTSSCKSQKTIFDETDKFLLIDLLITYLDSADNHIVLRACEGIMIISSLPDNDIANLIISCSPVCEVLIQKLVEKYKAVPRDTDPCDVDMLNIGWGFVAEETFGDKFVKFQGYRELCSFLSWLDYCDTLVKECHPHIASHLARIFRQNFLEAAVEMIIEDVGQTILVTAIITKCLRVIDSFDFANEISNWLVGDGDLPEWPMLHTMINNCLSENSELSVESLRFFEAILEKPTEHSLHRLVLCHLTSRGYLSRPNATFTDDDERDRLNAVSLQKERDDNRQAMAQLIHEGHIAGQISEFLPGKDTASTIHKVINSYLLLLPKALLSDPGEYEQYVHEAQKQYQGWLDVAGTFQWSQEVVWSDNTSNSTHSYDSRPEADHQVIRSQSFTKIRRKSIKEKPNKRTTGNTKTQECCPVDDNSDTIGRCGRPAKQCPFKQNLVLRRKDRPKSIDIDCSFSEGPFLKMIFDLFEMLPDLPYQINLQLTSILSKLAMLPHPNAHEFFLNPMLPVANGTRTLYKVLQTLAKRLTAEIPKFKNYRKIIDDTRCHLFSDDHTFDERYDHNNLFESLIIVEEFSKELAGISLVKYQNGMHFSEF